MPLNLQNYNFNLELSKQYCKMNEEQVQTDRLIESDENQVEVFHLADPKDYAYLLKKAIGLPKKSRYTIGSFATAENAKFV